MAFVRDSEPCRQRKASGEPGSRPEHGHSVYPALPRLDPYVGTDRKRIRQQDLGPLPNLPDLAFHSRRHTLAIAHDDEGTHQRLTLGGAPRDFGRYGFAVAGPILDDAPNHGE